MYMTVEYERQCFGGNVYREHHLTRGAAMDHAKSVAGSETCGLVLVKDMNGKVIENFEGVCTYLDERV